MSGWVATLSSCRDIQLDRFNLQTLQRLHSLLRRGTRVLVPFWTEDGRPGWPSASIPLMMADFYGSPGQLPLYSIVEDGFEHRCVGGRVPASRRGLRPISRRGYTRYAYTGGNRPTEVRYRFASLSFRAEVFAARPRTHWLVLLEERAGGSEAAVIHAAMYEEITSACNIVFRMSRGAAS